MRDLAREMQHHFGDGFPLNHADSPFALQFYLNTARPQISAAQAAELLSADCPAVVTVSDFEKLRNALPASTVLHEIGRWPSTREPTTRILSNVPRPELTNRLAIMIGPLAIQMEDSRLAGTKREELTFMELTPNANVTISNQSMRPRSVFIRFQSQSGSVSQGRWLEPRQSWHCRARPEK
jgi:hypothetical protein